jgi:hypothetical protein
VSIFFSFRLLLGGDAAPADDRRFMLQAVLLATLG